MWDDSDSQETSFKLCRECQQLLTDEDKKQIPHAASTCGYAVVGVEVAQDSGDEAIGSNDPEAELESPDALQGDTCIVWNKGQKQHEVEKQFDAQIEMLKKRDQNSYRIQQQLKLQGAIPVNG